MILQQTINAIKQRFKDKNVDAECMLWAIEPKGNSGITTINTYAVLVKNDVFTQELLDYTAQFSYDDLLISLIDGMQQFSKEGQIDYFIIKFEAQKRCEV